MPRPALLVRCTAAVLAAAAGADGSASSSAPPAASVTVAVAAAAPLHPPFPDGWLGVNLDAASLHNRVDLADPYLRTVTRALWAAANTTAPLVLRVGGTAANAAVYVPDGAGAASTVVSDATLAGLQDFAAAVGATINPFGLPYQTGADGRWAAGLNASALWAHVGSANLTAFGGWSLGNEIQGDAGFNNTRYNEDYVERFLPAVAALAPAWARAAYGPSAPGFPGEPVEGPFAAAAGAALAGAGGALSFHAYSFKNCSLPVFLDKAGMERMAYYYGAWGALRDAFAPGVPLYLEEFATAAGGGCDGLSNTFASGFWWVHALGLAAGAGVARVTRQDLVGWSFNTGPSHYPLVGPPGWVNRSAGGAPTPHPDWYTMLLWRQVVGTAVLGVAVSPSPPDVNDTVAVHAFCTARGFAAAPPGAVTLVFFNVHPTDAVAVVVAGGVPAVPRVEFILTPPGGNATADGVELNGGPWAVGPDGALPALPVPGHAVSDPTVPLALPPLSYGFVVLADAAAPACEF
jgi:hypothetical protein